MKQKLLNFSKNLIISLGLVVIVMILFFTTSSYAATTQTLGKLMRGTISDWYRFILRTSLTVFSIGYLIIVLKLLADRTPDRMKTLKESIGRFFIMFIVIYFLHYIMLMIIMLNAEFINTAKQVGASFSGIDMQNDEYDLYETALSKAYEFAAVPGIIGLIMYLLLVYYTYKFVFVYAKRYINIVVLTLIAPMLFVLSTIKKILTGANDGKIGKWFKEYIFNIVIQVFHAIFYAILIGLTLKLSDNDENLIGALLTLVLFGFIFKIDAIIRKIFNFVGGSTKISSSKAVGTAINATGNAVGMGLDALSGGIDTAGNKLIDRAGSAGNSIRENGLKQTASDGIEAAKVRFKELPGQFKEKASEFGNIAKDKAIELGEGAQSRIKDYGVQLADKTVKKAKDAYAYAKAEAEDFDNIMNGERVKANLTSEEIIAAQHSIENGEGLEALRQKMQHAGIAVAGFVANTKAIGQYTSKQLKKAYNFASGRVKAGINSAIDEFNKDVRILNLENEVELVKKLPKIIKNYNKRCQLLKFSYQGVKLDSTNAMMLAVDFNIDTKALIEEIKKEYTKGNPLLYAAFEELGAQVLLSPVVGSARFGMALLAEDRYEEVAEHRIEQTITGRQRDKRVIKESSRLSQMKLATISNIEIEQDKLNSSGEVKEHRRYTFNRFNAVSARKITNRMLHKRVQRDGYLSAISRTRAEVQVNSLGARGGIYRRTTEIGRTIQATRTNKVKSIRKMKLRQQSAIIQHKNIVRQTRRVEMANTVADQIMTATNTVKLSFMQIDQMTYGQIGLRKMVKEGYARELSNGLVMMKQNGTIEDKIRATGLLRTDQSQTVTQFVMTDNGNIVQQIVNLDGKILQYAQEEKVEQQSQPQDLFKQVITEALTQYMQPSNSEERPIEKVEEEQKKVAFKQLMNEVFKQYIEPTITTTVTVTEEDKVEEPKTLTVATEENKVEEPGDNFTKAILEAFTQYIEPQAVKERAPVKIEEGETETEVQFKEFIEKVYEEYVAQPDISQLAEIKEPIEAEESTNPSEKIVQHIVTLEGLIVEQVVNKDNTIETGSYNVIEQADDKLLTQVQNAVPNEDLGLEESATIEERVAKFQDLLEDVKREDATSPLLAEVLAEPVKEEEKELVTVLAGMQEAGIETISELQQLQFVDGLDEEGLQKKEEFERFMTTQPNVGYSLDDEDDDRLEDAFSVLNNSIETVTNTDSTTLFDVASELERARIAEDLMDTGEFTVENPPTDEDIDGRIQDLSQLLINLAKDKAVNTLKETIQFPKEILEDTASAMTEVIENAAKGTLSKEEIEAEENYKNELEKAEKKWAKKHGEEVDTEIVDRIINREKGKENNNENVVVKITLKFFGGVEAQGQAITLSNRYSVKDFYDKVKKLNGASLEKTQERFLQTYGDKLKNMQLLPFSFAKNPVEDMDGWSIYVVTNQEDVTEGDKEKEEKVKDEPIEEEIVDLIEKYFSDIRRIFVKFVEEYEINSFDEIYDDATLENELVRRIRIFLFRQGEKDEEEKAEKVVLNLYKDVRFRDILKDCVKDRLAKNESAESVKNAKSKVKVVNKKMAENEAASRVTEGEVEEIKNKEKSNLMNQILDSVMTEQEKAAEASPDLADLLNQLKNSKVFVTTPGGEKDTQDRRVLTYQIGKGEMMP